MKVGIITLPLHYNYGGILQAYALQTAIERLGHEVHLLRQNEFKAIPRHATLRYAKRYLNKILHGGGEVFVEKRHNEEFPILAAKTWPFVESYIHSQVVTDFSDISESDYDCFVVGSDQVWRSGYTKTVRTFFLDFAENWKVKRIAYAASFGLDSWSISPKDTPVCKRLAKTFDYISVREDTGIGLCQKYLGVDARQVLDPTMLLTSEDYVDIIEKSLKEPVFSTYILDETPEKKEIIREIQNRESNRTVKLFTKEHHKIQPLASIEEWLNTFRKSSFVFTDSFHGVVFSIIFNRQFVVFQNGKRGNSRMESLLKQFGLENRLISSVDDYWVISNELIDYEIINKRLKKLREESLNYLITALKK